MAEALPLKIGAVASRSGLSVKTIRFYCDQGLIRPSGRSEGGYRLFGAEVCTCTDLQSRIRAKAGEIGQKIEALHTLQSGLLTMLNSWEDCGGRRTGPAAAGAAPQPVAAADQPQERFARGSEASECRR